jgi:hypothetical protein
LGVPRGYAPWPQGGGFCPAREGEAESLDGIEATVGRGKAKLFPLRVDLWRRIMVHLRKALAMVLIMAVLLTCQWAWGIEKRRQVLSTPSYASGEILVVFQSGVPKERIDDINAMLGTSVLKSTGRLFVIRVPSTETVEGMVEKYNAMPGVDYAEPNYIMEVDEED